MPPCRNNRRNETLAVDPIFAAAVLQAVRALLPELTIEIAAGMNNANRRNRRSGGNGNGGNPPTPVEADNWIAHIEKFFEVLGRDDQFKARLATYKLKGDAHSWRAYKQAKGGDAYVETLSWNDFRAILFLPFFPRLEQEKYEREYKSVRQRDGESSAKFMTRFVRLVGFLGAKAGTPDEQAKNFKWALNDIARDKLVNMEFSDVAEVANAARNIEILQKEMLALTPNENKKRTQENEQDENEARSGK
ncbi:zinc finger, CCHC-type, retrotransposon gag domain protein [Tanacetum coccineum]